MNKDLEEVDDLDEDFSDGFTNEAKPTDAKPGEATTATPVVEKTEATTTEAQTGTPPAEAAVVAAPEFIQITQAQWDAIKASAARTEGMDKRIKDTVLGTVGDLEQRIIKKLQAATPAGSVVELPADVVSELETDFPELAPRIKKTLEKALKGLRGTGESTAPDWETVVKAAAIAYQKEALEDQYPNWREIVGPVTDGKFDPKNEYRIWLATQPADYQHKVNNTNSAQVISRSIDRFTDAKKEAAKKVEAKPATPAPKAAARHNVIRGAVQPKGDGGQPSPTNTAEDELESGFASG